MPSKPRAVAIVSTIIASALILSGFSSANADEARDLTSAAAPAYIIVQSSDARQVGSAKFYPTGPISDDTVIVIADSAGNLPGGLTEAELAGALAEAKELAQRNSAGAPQVIEFGSAAAPQRAVIGTQWGAGFGCEWGAVATRDPAIWAMNDSVRVKYLFGVTNGTQQRAAGQGLGFFRGYNGSELGVWERWYDVGIASGDGANGTGTVPWGNVLAYAKFRGKSLFCAALAIGQFQAGGV